MRCSYTQEQRQPGVIHRGGGSVVHSSRQGESNILPCRCATSRPFTFIAVVFGYTSTRISHFCPHIRAVRLKTISPRWAPLSHHPDHFESRPTTVVFPCLFLSIGLARYHVRPSPHLGSLCRYISKSSQQPARGLIFWRLPYNFVSVLWSKQGNMVNRYRLR